MVRRQDDEAGVAHADEVHQDEVRGGLGVVDFARVEAFLEVAEGGVEQADDADDADDLCATREADLTDITRLPWWSARLK